MHVHEKNCISMFTFCSLSLFQVLLINMPLLLLLRTTTLFPVTARVRQSSTRMDTTHFQTLSLSCVKRVRRLKPRHIPEWPAAPSTRRPRPVSSPPCTPLHPLHLWQDQSPSFDQPVSKEKNMQRVPTRMSDHHSLQTCHLQPITPPPLRHPLIQRPRPPRRPPIQSPFTRCL